MKFTVTQWTDKGGTIIGLNTWTLQAPDSAQAVLAGVPFSNTLDGEFTTTKHYGEYRTPSLVVRAVADRS